MMRTKQTARISIGGKDPRRQLAVKPKPQSIYSDMFRNHVGPFPLSKYVPNKDKESNNTIENIPRKKSQLTRGGIWQFAYPDWIYNKSLKSDNFYPYCFKLGQQKQNQSKENNFEYIDISFDILDNKCLFLPLQIKIVLKQYLEPLYIDAYFLYYKGNGRGMMTQFSIWKCNKWIVFAKIFRSHFADEDEGEYLKTYESIWECVQCDNEINSRFSEEMHQNQVMNNKFWIERDKEDKEWKELKNKKEKTNTKRKVTETIDIEPDEPDKKRTKLLK
eukprot:535627_1